MYSSNYVPVPNYLLNVREISKKPLQSLNKVSILSMKLVLPNDCEDMAPVLFAHDQNKKLFSVRNDKDLYTSLFNTRNEIFENVQVIYIFNKILSVKL
jgi:hypothetical protein